MATYTQTFLVNDNVKKNDLKAINIPNVTLIGSYKEDIIFNPSNTSYRL